MVNIIAAMPVKRKMTEKASTSVAKQGSKGKEKAVSSMQLPKRKKFTVAHARQMLLDSDEEDDILASNYADIDDEFESEDSDEETQTQMADEQLLGTWSVDTSTFSVAESEFKPLETVGLKNIPNSITKDSFSVDFLLLFWDESVWNLITDETNRQATHIKEEKPNNYSAKSFHPVTVAEMKAFFGCRIAMELLIYKDRYSSYWKQKDNWITSTPGFGKVFTRDRFLAIWSMLHCVNERDENVDKSDKLYKSRPIFNIILPNFQRYYVPDCELSLDEGMIPTKNALSFKQYIKDKPIRWGLKTFLLCESKTGYIMNAEMYTGKVALNEDLEKLLGVTGCLVARLCDPIQGRNHCIFTDRFYTSVNTAEYLLQTKTTRLCGTCMTNRKRFPKELVKKKMDRGSNSMLYNGKTAALVWCDKKPIYFLSTKYVRDADVSVLRYDKKEHKRMPVPCPAIVKSYNSFMGGTDKNDQMTKLQKSRRHYKWPRRLMVKFFVWSAYNAYIIQDHYKPHKLPGKRLHTFHMFIDKLCHELVGTYRRTNMPTARRETSDVRLLNQDNIPLHLAERPASATTNNRCFVCAEKYKRAKRANPQAKDKDLPKRTKTVYWCKTCEVFLCIGSDNNNCFAIYHTRVDFWR